MAQTPMYAAMANSPGTELSADISASDTEISVLDASKLPAAPNLFTVGNDETAETILYSGKSGNKLTGCTRGFNGTAAKGWSTGAKVARNFTGYDHDTFIANIEDLDGRVTTAQATADTAETPEGAQEKADTAEANAVNEAKAYADNNFFKKSTLTAPNLIKNSGALFDFNNWKKTSDLGGGWRTGTSDIGKFFYTDGAIASGSYAILDSDPIRVGSSTYTYSVSFYTTGTNTGSLFTEIKDAANVNGEAIASIGADLNKSWHRKTVTFTVPSSVASIVVRIVVSNVSAGATRAVSRMKISAGDQETQYTTEYDELALFQYVSNGKNAIASAITDKGVPASGSDTFPVLADKIEQIPNGVSLNIQRGQLTMGASESQVSAIFSAVDVTKSIVRMMVLGTESIFRNAHISARIDSAISAVFRRNFTGSFDNYIFYEIIEFENAKSIQKGSGTFQGGNAAIYFTAVDPAKSLIFYTYRTNDGSQLTFASGYNFASPTQANLRMDVNGTNNFEWYLVEFQ
ncbi:hypothetical protein [Paenibacillus sp. OAE614]|uniref:hypothetical protein n=1 Tax=Paenibacillus sp. OAE614 TaxID=2663804 RepID=UPI00178A3034